VIDVINKRALACNLWKVSMFCVYIRCHGYEV